MANGGLSCDRAQRKGRDWQEMEKKLEETSMGSLLYRKTDYIKPYSRQDSLMVAATTSDLKVGSPSFPSHSVTLLLQEKAKEGFKSTGSSALPLAQLDSKMAELEAKLRLPNKSGARPVSAILGALGGSLASTPSASINSLRAPPPPPKPKTRPSPVLPVLGAAARQSLCFVCEGPVYLAEKLTAEGLTLHKRCFKCAYCQTPLR